MSLSYAERLERSRRIITAIAAGDALGATGELKRHAEIPALLDELAETGWPFVQAGGGPFELEPGGTTDETGMAMCIFHSFREIYRFDPGAAVDRLIEWMRSHPPGIKPSVSTALTWSASGDHWYDGALREYNRGTQPGFSNALAINGLAASMAATLDEAFKFSVQQCMITSFSPDTAVVCCAHTFMLMELLGGGHPPSDWRREFELLFRLWLDREKDRSLNVWRDTVGDRITESLDSLMTADLSVEEWSPLHTDWGKSSETAMHMFRIALWALHWSRCSDDFQVPHSYFPESLFRRRCADTLGWVAITGHHSDACAAAAAPLLASAHGGLPAGMTAGLDVLHQIESL